MTVGVRAAIFALSVIPTFWRTTKQTFTVFAIP